ncbi:MAG TPA: Crp/Fnr family transcriptional regulator [Puia sp.]|nr:Crp/Fnr family transcriptional regulator [Puia sp.]
MDYDRIIRNISTHIVLDEEELEFFTSLFVSRTLRRHEFLLHAGNTCRNMSFVDKGCLKVFHTDEKGLEHIVKFAPEDWWAMDIESFALQIPSFYSIQAIEDCGVLCLSKENYDLLGNKVPKFEKFLRILFQNSFISLQRRIQQGLSDNAGERYRHFQEKYPTLEQRISQKQIASYLGITPEFLSMLRGQLSRRAIS